MYQNLQPTHWAIALLIEPFRLWRFRFRWKSCLPNVPNALGGGHGGLRYCSFRLFFSVTSMLRCGIHLNFVNAVLIYRRFWTRYCSFAVLFRNITVRPLVPLYHAIFCFGLFSHGKAFSQQQTVQLRPKRSNIKLYHTYIFVIEDTTNALQRTVSVLHIILLSCVSIPQARRAIQCEDIRRGTWNISNYLWMANVTATYTRY